MGPWTSKAPVWPRALFICVFASGLLVQDGLGLRARHNRVGRHRRVPEPVADPEGRTFGEVQEQQQNQHKPVFENCEHYQPSVNEGAPGGRT
jgi:hypothetical protein